MTEISVYIDESGNSGFNYLDKNQPFFVLGGWVIPTSQVDQVERKILDWELSLKSQTAEIKGANLVKRIRGRKSILKLFEIMVNSNAVPTYAIMEKRLGVCAKFIESIFDISYNTAIPRSFFQNSEAKYNLADTLYSKVSDDTIYAFGRAVQSKDRNEVEKHFAIIKKFALELNVPEFSRYIPSCPEIAAVDFLTAGDNISGAINNTMLLVLISNIEKLARLYGLGAWNLYHDNVDSFAESLSALHVRLRGGWASYLKEEFFANLPEGEYSIRNFQFLDSQRSPLIRAADCFSALCRFYLEHVDDADLFSDPVDQTGILQTLGPLLRYILGDEEFPPTYHEVLSSDVAAKAVNRITENLKG